MFLGAVFDYRIGVGDGEVVGVEVGGVYLILVNIIFLFKLSIWTTRGVFCSENL